MAPSTAKASTFSGAFRHGWCRNGRCPTVELWASSTCDCRWQSCVLQFTVYVGSGGSFSPSPTTQEQPSPYFPRLSSFCSHFLLVALSSLLSLLFAPLNSEKLVLTAHHCTVNMNCKLTLYSLLTFLEYFNRRLLVFSSLLHLHLFRALCSSLQLVFWLVQAFHGQFIYDPLITREVSVICRPSPNLVRVMRRPTDRS